MVRKSTKRKAKRPVKRGVKRNRNSSYRKSGKRMEGKLSMFVLDDPFPPRCQKIMTYGAAYKVQVQAVTTSFGTPIRFSLNNIWTILLSGGAAVMNTSAYGYTEMATLYNRYKVKGCKIEVKFFDPDADYLVCGAMLLNAGNTADSISNYNIGSITRQPMSWNSAIVNSGEQTRKFSQYLPMHLGVGWSKIQFDADVDGTTAAMGSTTATQPVLEIAVADNDASNTLKTVQVSVRISYYTEFYQRKIYD